jgi:hypothetical protein
MTVLAMRRGSQSQTPRPSPYDLDLDRNPATCASLTPLNFLAWAGLFDCKGKQTPVVTSYSLQYWEVRIENGTTSVCAASDGERGCKTL